MRTDPISDRLLTVNLHLTPFPNAALQQACRHHPLAGILQAFRGRKLALPDRLRFGVSPGAAQRALKPMKMRFHVLFTCASIQSY
jgi:hypothetical protein